VAELQDLLRAIDDDIEDPAHWHPLADYLIERDDPRGELIMIDLALESRGGDRDALLARRRAILAASAPKLLGDTFARVIAEGYGQVTWRRGFVDEVQYCGDAELGHRKAVGWLIRLITEVHEPFAFMRRLDLAWTDISDVTPLARFPHLERIVLAGTNVDRAKLDALRRLRPRLVIEADHSMNDT
jgi:hypothetical protein